MAPPAVPPRDDVMRICFLSSDFTPETAPGAGGGIETYVRLIGRGLAERGHQVHVVLPTSGPTRRLYEGAVTMHAIHLPAGSTLDGGPDSDNPVSLDDDLIESRAALSFARHAHRKVRALIEEDGPFDIVEAPEYKAQGFGLAGDPEVPLVVKCHAHLRFCLDTNGIALTPDTALLADLERETLGATRAVHANSRFLAERVAADYALDPSCIAHVPYGIDTDHFIPTSSQLRRRLGIGERPVLLFAGRMEERKGLSVVVRAFADIAAQRPDVLLLLAGADVCGAGHASNVAWMCREWERLGVPSHRFLFLGNVARPDMPAVYSAADLLLAPSPAEAFGFVYLEAMACGCPPIGCTTGGAPEVVADGQTGVLVPPHDADALGRRAIELIDDSARRRALGAHGRAHVVERFSLAAMVHRTEHFYQHIVLNEAAA